MAARFERNVLGTAEPGVALLTAGARGVATM
jgi:hypothetical protein